MSTTWRRYEVLLPLNFNDGREVPDELLAEAVIEIRTHFGAVRYETQRIEGQWQQEGILYQDELSCLVIDLPDTAKNRKWMKQFKARWKERLDQLELWMVSYPIEIE
jgi:hypothetical protein